MHNFVRAALSVSALALLIAAGSPRNAHAVLIDQPAPEAVKQAAQSPITPNSPWSAAKAGRFDEVLAALAAVVPGQPGGLAGLDSPGAAAFAAQVAALQASVASRESVRAEYTAKLTKDLDKTVAGDRRLPNLSKGLRQAIELQMLSADKAAVLTMPSVKTLTDASADAARTAEKAGDWLIASELFGRLNLLFEDDSRFKADAKRMGERLSMIRLYNPQRLHALRNDRRKEEGLKPLPAFNMIGEDYQSRLVGIDEGTVLRAINTAGENHVEGVPLPRILIGGLASIRTLISTHDLDATFPGIADQVQVTKFLAVLDEQQKLLETDKGLSPARSAVLIDTILEANAATIKLPKTAILHEFGNGAFDKLDEFSAIIWPDEVLRFKRMTEGSFRGVGIQIQNDEEKQMIKVIAPLEGSPAQKAGIRAGDLLKKINDKSAVGMTTEQAVEQITGATNTKVRMTIERAGEDIEFEMVRTTLKLPSVRGFARTGNRDTDWNYFIDESNGIGYIRVSGFSEATTRDIRQVLNQLRSSESGLRGLVFDLRYNPGGLLDQAVSISNLFINEGTIVYTEAAKGIRRSTERADEGRAVLKDIPVVVLINETSASASEIVSGAVRHYADLAKVNAIVLGNRSYGKGSVQNVIPLSNSTQMKLTTQYYYLPGGQLIHRREGAKLWGVEPHLRVEMIVKQQTDALVLRSDADLTKDAERPEPKEPKDDEMPTDDTRKGPPDAQRLISESIDLQLQTAVSLLQSQVFGRVQAQAQPPKPK